VIETDVSVSEIMQRKTRADDPGVMVRVSLVPLAWVKVSEIIAVVEPAIVEMPVLQMGQPAEDVLDDEDFAERVARDVHDIPPEGFSAAAQIARLEDVERFLRQMDHDARVEWAMRCIETQKACVRAEIPGTGEQERQQRVIRDARRILELARDDVLAARELRGSTMAEIVTFLERT
jgi:hypothetical protein